MLNPKFLKLFGKSWINSSVVSTIFVYTSGIVAILFLIIVYGHAFSKGGSHSDDSYIATGAKNVAFGLGYSSSITPDGTGGIYYFPPGFTTGPTLGLPAAAMIGIFGNQPWVPGFTAVTINMILLVLIVLAIKRSYGIHKAMIFFLFFLFLFYSLSVTGHFVQWFALLGEMPAILLTILGIFLISGSPEKRSVIILSGLSFGLAFLAKMVSLLGFLPVFIWMISRIFASRDKRGQSTVNFFLLFIAAALPLVVFDIYKLYSLGFAGYIENFKVFFSSLNHWHDLGKEPVKIDKIQFNSSFSERLAAFKNHFGYSQLTLMLLAIILGILVSHNRKDRFIRLGSLLLLFGAILEILWWTSLSKGWPRYALPGLFLFLGALSLLVLMKTHWIFKVPLLALIMFIFSSSMDRMIVPLKYVLQNHFCYSSYIVNQQKTTTFLNTLKPSRPFFYTWWATVADLEYSLNPGVNFKQLDYLEEEDFRRDLYLVINSKWDNPYYSPKFKNQKKRFDKVIFTASPFKVLKYSAQPKVLELDKPIDFSANGNCADYITFGWGMQEPSYVMTTSYKAGLLMVLRNNLKNDLLLKLQGYGISADGHSCSRIVAVIFNGKRLITWRIHDPGWYEVLIPREYVNAFVNQIAFRIFTRPIKPVSKKFPRFNTYGIAVNQIIISESKDNKK